MHCNRRHPTDDRPLNRAEDLPIVEAWADEIRSAMRNRGAVKVAATAPTGADETVSTWFGRYYAWRAASAHGESAADSRGRFTKWIEPKIGDLRMRDVTPERLEDFVSYLDTKVAAGKIAWKTAANIWAEITAAFYVAATGMGRRSETKDRSLKILPADPASGVARPNRGAKRSKPFLRPDEVTKLLACEDVPIERRHVYAVAIYTAMRQGVDDADAHHAALVTSR